MLHFNNTQHSGKASSKRRSNRPVRAFYNTYFNTLVITTDLDIRVYNCYTGKLEKVFVDHRIIDSEAETIKGYSEGALYRKFYIGDSKGTIDCFNFLNGEKLKSVNNIQEDQVHIEKFAGK